MDQVLKERSQASAVWKNPCLKSTTDKLYEQRHETGDIKFIVGSEEIPAHRCVLAALSPKYKAQFYGPLAEKDVIHVEDVSPASFNEFLQLFYLDEVTLTVENIEDVLNLAKQSLVEELIAVCINFVFDVIGVDKLVWCYRLAIDYGIQPLEEFCLKQIGANVKSVFQSPDFLICDQQMLCHILDIDLLNCNEIDVFDACIAWARAKSEDEGIDAAHAVNLRAALGDAVFKIRFCSMTAEQFAAIGKKYSGLLSGQESTEVFQAILLKANGEVSSIFGADNSKPRKSIPSTLECSFSKGLLKTRNGVTDCDWTVFSCNKSINLNGFVICDRIDCDVVVKVKVADVLQKFDFIKLVSDNETKIISKNPINIKGNEHCRIEIETQLKQLQHGFNIESSVRLGDISFKFNEAYCVCLNSITRLLYNTID